MNFLELLGKYGLTAETVSGSIRKKIKAYEKLQAAMQAQQAELPSVTQTRRKKSMEKDIQQAEEALVQINTELVSSIEKYNQHKDRYLASAERLRTSRLPSNPPAEPNNPPVEPPAEPPAEPNNPPAEPPVEPVDEPVKEPEKKGSGFGWIIGGAVLIIGAAVGINFYQNRN